MKLVMIGAGYVGLVSGTCFAEFGMDVVCVERDPAKVAALQQGSIPIYEPALEALLAKQLAAGRIAFTTELASAVAEADVVFIAVGTPRRESDGQADLSHVFTAVEQIAQAMRGYTVIVTKSTVPVGTARQVIETIRRIRPDAVEGQDFDVCSNPEFLREGAAISDFMRPDRVVIGCTSQRAEAVMRKLYQPLYLNETPVVVTSHESAEIIKYASNAFLATKITFINEIADLCEVAGGNVQHVAKAMGMDGRIGSKFLHAGAGYGGSCFPKDTLALAATGRQFAAPQTIVEAVVAANTQRQQQLASRVITACNNSVAGKTIAVLGLAFKPNTDDMRDAPSLALISGLQQAGATVIATDPAAIHTARPLLPGVKFTDDAYQAATGADAVVLVTEWNEFRALSLPRLAACMRGAILVDLRNVFKPADALACGLKYVSVGRPISDTLTDK